MKLKVGSDCSGVGSFIQALKRIGIDYEEIFACDFDYYARLNYCVQYGTDEDVKIAQSKQHKKYCDEVKRIALMDASIEVCDKDKQILVDANDFAKTFSFYFPFNMYEREVPADPLGIYVSSVPCQSFSLAGKRKGKDDKRGILFFSSLDFIRENKPKYFILENVKGLLSHDKTDKKAKYGKTFSEWINYLGGKSINGNATFIPYEDSVPYHIYFQVLNAKEHGVPQNRERIFIVGIRDYVDNNFRFPIKEVLKLRLKDVLEPIVDEKYFLSDKMIDYLTTNSIAQKEAKNGFAFKPKTEDDISNSITTKCGQRMGDNFIIDDNSDLQVTHGYANGYVESEVVEDNTPEVRQLNPSKESGRKNILIDEPNLVNEYTCNCGHIFIGKLNTPCPKCGSFTGYENPLKSAEPNLIKVGTLYENDSDAGRIYSSDGISTTMKSDGGGMGAKTGLYEVEQEPNIIQLGRGYNKGGEHDICPPITSNSWDRNNYLNNKRIRRLTPTEVMRLMNFEESFMDNVRKYNEANPKNILSDSQLYHQGGNSIVVACLEKIIKNLKF